MDYPKSVPSVGLVNGKFVDEDPGAGTPGSLIPSAWGNAVTDEILAVITDAGLAPDEENHGQLKEALNLRDASATATQVEAEGGVDNTKRMTPLRVFQAIAKVVKQSTESAFGWAKVATQVQVTTGTDDATIITPKKLRAAQATQAQVDAGVDDTTIVTPKKMSSGFAASLGSTGYLKLPSWLGGLVFQWGITNTIASGQSQNVTLPFAFPSGTMLFVTASINRSANDQQGGTYAIGFDASVGGVVIVRNTTVVASSLSFKYFVLGV